MCEYCKKDKRKTKKFLINNPIISLRIVTNNLCSGIEILSINRKNEVVKGGIVINYCPMCGRKLGDEDK
jgi:hypothetical protein